MRMWRYAVVKLLQHAYQNGSLIIPSGLQDLCPTFLHFSAWLKRRLHKPWIVHIAKPTKNPILTINYLGRYLPPSPYRPI